MTREARSLLGLCAGTNPPLKRWPHTFFSTKIPHRGVRFWVMRLLFFLFCASIVIVVCQTGNVLAWVSFFLLEGALCFLCFIVFFFFLFTCHIPRSLRTEAVFPPPPALPQARSPTFALFSSFRAFSPYFKFVSPVFLLPLFCAVVKVLGGKLACF